MCCPCVSTQLAAIYAQVLRTRCKDPGLLVVTSQGTCVHCRSFAVSLTATVHPERYKMTSRMTGFFLLRVRITRL
jgi:hypothetical protein